MSVTRRDVLTGASTALLGTFVPMHGAEARRGDSLLLDLCMEWEGIRAAPYASEEEGDRLGDRLTEIEDQLATLPALTRAGALAKTQLARRLVGEGCIENDLLNSVFDDLLRLANGGAA